MSKRRRNNERKPSRRKPFRRRLPIILIVCEGSVTEPQYFEGFRNSCKNARVDIELIDEGGYDPLTLVKHAKMRKAKARRTAQRQNDLNISYNAVWCVFDVDDHHHISDAKQEARDAGIELAISNPCFELWLLLHHQEPPGAQSRLKIRQLLKKHVSDYEKHVDYERYRTGYDAAVKRAEQLDRLAMQGGDEGRNPTSGVYRLTEIIRVN